MTSYLLQGRFQCQSLWRGSRKESTEFLIFKFIALHEKKKSEKGQVLLKNNVGEESHRGAAELTLAYGKRGLVV